MTRRPLAAVLLPLLSLLSLPAEGLPYAVAERVGYPSSVINASVNNFARGRVDAGAFLNSEASDVPFDAARLARIQASLEKQGVSFLMGEEGARFARTFGAEAVYFPTEPGRPGLIALGTNPSRTAVVEELLHLGQHRRLGWGVVQDRIFQLEIEAQEKLLKIGRKLGWTEDELRAIAIARSRWKELAGIE
jgi:hypothetical protein